MPPDTPFAAVVNQMMAGAFGYHPDWQNIDWSKVQWLKSSQPWTPQMDKSVGENGLQHKDVLRFKTPGLNGVAGSCS